MKGLMMRIASLSAAGASEDLGSAFSLERWGYAGRMTLVGLGAVFGVLVVLMIVLYIFQKVFAKNSAKQSKIKAKVSAKVEQPTEKANEKGETVNTVAAEETVMGAAEDEALVAVLAAAIAAYRESEASDGMSESGFRVVSFRRAGTRAWNVK